MAGVLEEGWPRLSGGIIRLLRLLRDHPDAVEADLSRYHHLDLRDYWTRRTRKGRRVLSFRMLSVRVRHLPLDSATGQINLGDLWINNRTELLLVEIWESLTGHRHHLRPPETPKAESPDRQKKLAAARKRAQERRAAIERGEIT